MNLHEKILAVMQDVQYLAKDDHVEYKTTSYKALSEEKVTSIMRAALLKHKLVVYPIEQTATRAGTITHVDTRYRLVNVEDPTDFIDIVSAGDGADTQDKGTGKAMTYAYKYMWLRTFALPTGEDPDKICSAELDAKNIQPTTAAPEVSLQVVQDLAKTALSAWAQRTGKDSKTVNAECREFIGKTYKDFTSDDWRKVTEEFQHKK